MTLNHTHDPAARSWLASANAAGTDFPIQNLPLGILKPKQLLRLIGGQALLSETK